MAFATAGKNFMGTNLGQSDGSRQSQCFVVLMRRVEHSRRGHFVSPEENDRSEGDPLRLGEVLLHAGDRRNAAQLDSAQIIGLK